MVSRLWLSAVFAYGYLWSDGPCQTVWLAADVNVAGNAERLQINNGDVIIGRAGDKGSRTIGLHLDTRGAPADRHALSLGSRRCIQNRQISLAQARDENQFAIGRELEPVSASHVGTQRRHLLL